MRLLIVTQAVDSDDPFLGFFVEWINALAKQFDSLCVVCLKRGSAELAANVSVSSLGKEMSQSRVRYVMRFFHSIWTLRREYDAVFVHMNQEYVLLGALLWRILGKRVYLWRNHVAGGFGTSLAVMLADKTFCTSKFSYIASAGKNVLMPVGVDTDNFRPVEGVARKPRSILSFGRFAPSKRPDLLIESLGRLSEGGWSAAFVGSPLPKDSAYEAGVRARADALGLQQHVAFLPGIPHRDAPSLFSAHEIYVNLAASGMYDKTIFEAGACGCIVLAASRDYAALVDARYVCAADGSDLAQKLRALLGMSDDERSLARVRFRALAESQSLESLAVRLRTEMSI